MLGASLVVFSVIMLLAVAGLSVLLSGNPVEIVASLMPALWVAPIAVCAVLGETVILVAYIIEVAGMVTDPNSDLATFLLSTCLFLIAILVLPALYGTLLNYPDASNTRNEWAPLAVAATLLLLTQLGCVFGQRRMLRM